MSTSDFCYEYPRPALTVDSMIFSFRKEKLNVLLIKRADEPFKDLWAFPGGFVNEGESAEIAVQRELNEETGLKNISLKQFYTATEPGRDPRGWTISVVFMGFLSTQEHSLKAGDDAGEVAWFPLNELPILAFDHQQIFDLGFNYMKKNKRYISIAKLLLDESFAQQEFHELGAELGLSENSLSQRFNRLYRAGLIIDSELNGKFKFDFSKVSKQE